MASTTQLERYRDISELGSGGMATVTLAEDTLLGRQVALKRLYDARADVRGLSRLRREALVGASVSHPNLVSIYDVLTAENGDHVIVMEYVPGETLRDALQRQTRLRPQDAIPILAGVAAALDAIHRRGIVHRDVKPANVLLGGDGVVKLADLGIASVADRTRITTDGAVLGTVSYMAPEQLEGRRATPAVDIYALGAVAFEMLCGRKARTEANPVALAHALSTQPPPDIRQFWPQASRAVAEVLMRAMARDPATRPRSAGELAGRLRAALEPETTAPVALPAAPRPRPRAVPPAAAAVPAAVASSAAAPKTPAAPQPARAASRAASTSRPPASSRPAAAPAPTRTGPRSRTGLIAAGLLALAAAAVVLAVVLSGGSSTSGTSGSGAKRASTSHNSNGAGTGGSPTSGAGASGTGTSASSSPASSSPPATSGAGAGGPVSAVENFYTLAATHRYAAAWALADPSFRDQLRGFASFEDGQAADRSITFNSAQVLSATANTATVAVNTTSVQTTETESCAGTVDLVRGSGSWLLHRIDINCTPQS